MDQTTIFYIFLVVYLLISIGTSALIYLISKRARGSANEWKKPKVGHVLYTIIIIIAVIVLVSAFVWQLSD